MSRIEYDLLRADRTELGLPIWDNLTLREQDAVRRVGRESIITWGTYLLLADRDLGCFWPASLISPRNPHAFP